MRDARSLPDLPDVLAVEDWASGWLGDAWLDSVSEHQFHMEVVGRAGRPSPHGVAALAALRRLAAPAELPLLDGMLKILAESQPLPPWFDVPAFEPVRAWRAVDVWDSEHVLFVEFAGQFPHTLMAEIELVGGVLVGKLAILTPDAAESWNAIGQGPGEGPMPTVEAPVAEVLAELADALRSTDMTWPLQDDEDFVALRALAWSRSRAHLPDLADREQPDQTERDRLLNDFDPADRSLAELFLDYGEGWITSGPLYWSPGQVGLFLTDWLPRKVTLDAEQVAALPGELRRWIRFALHRRGVEPDWIAPVIQAVDSYLPSSPRPSPTPRGTRRPSRSPRSCPPAESTSQTRRQSTKL